MNLDVLNMVGCCSARWKARQTKVLFVNGRRDRHAFVEALSQFPSLSVTTTGDSLAQTSMADKGNALTRLFAGPDSVEKNVEKWFAQSVKGQRAMIFEANNQLQPYKVLVASGSGVGIVAQLLSQGHWSGPILLVCPDLSFTEELRSAQPPSPEVKREKKRVAFIAPLAVSSIIATLNALPSGRKQRCAILHGTDDQVVPFSEAQRLHAATGIQLVEIPAGDHDLQLIAEDGTLEQWIQRVVGGLSRPVSIESNGDGLPRRDSADGELLAGIEDLGRVLEDKVSQALQAIQGGPEPPDLAPSGPSASTNESAKFPGGLPVAAQNGSNGGVHQNGLQNGSHSGA